MDHRVAATRQITYKIGLKDTYTNFYEVFSGS